MEKKELRILFTDFWPGFDYTNNFFTKALANHFRIIIDDQTPQVIIYSCFGFEFLKYKKAIRVFYSGENIRPKFMECDFAMSFDYLDNKVNHLRLPLYALYAENDNLTKIKEVDTIINQQSKFCNMVVSNKRAKHRIEFFKILSGFKHVDSGGRVLNNIGHSVSNKLEFIKQYRFSFAFENESYPGYTTEKILEPMLVNSIPIYWGNPLIGREFNTKSFINIHDFGSLTEASEYILKIENNPQLYKQMLAEPWFNNNEKNEYFDTIRLVNFFEQVILNTPPFSKSQIYSRFFLATASSTYRLLAKKIIGRLV